MTSNSVCNHTRSSDFVISRMITDRIGLHSVLLPLLRAVVVFPGFREGYTLSALVPGRNVSSSISNLLIITSASPNIVTYSVRFRTGNGKLPFSSKYASLPFTREKGLAFQTQCSLFQAYS